jgi:hypothetical protein
MASAVVIGSVETGTDGPAQVTFKVHVSRVLTGDTRLSGQDIAVVHNWTRSGRFVPAVFPVNQIPSGMWFLTGGAASGWDVIESRPSRHGTFLALFLPAGAAPPAGAFGYGPGTPLTDALVYEVAAGVDLAGEDPEILSGAFASLNTPAGLDSAAIRKVLAAGVVSGDPALQAVALAGNLERQVPNAVQQLADSWPAINMDRHVESVIFALANMWRDTTPTSVQQLAAFAVGIQPGAEIRKAAARALAAIHSRETLPFLASLLSSADPTEQERAVYGISAFANGCPVQTPNNAVSMSYLQCNQASAYRTAATTANFAFRPGSPQREADLVSSWQNWWDGHPELH